MSAALSTVMQITDSLFDSNKMDEVYSRHDFDIFNGVALVIGALGRLQFCCPGSREMPDAA